MSIKTNEPRVGRTLIYGLIDPKTKHLRYIGKTHKKKENRLQEHIEAANSGKDLFVYKWMRKLIKNNSLPMIIILERVPPSSKWQEAEKRHIAHWGSIAPKYFPILYPPMSPKSTSTEIAGVSLTNLTLGGDIK